jgi:hypothetical protein
VTDLNKVRDELARKQQDYSRPMHREDEEYKLCGIDFKAGFDAAIAHLSKQIVAFDEARAAMFGVGQMKIGVSTDSAVIRGMRLEHQQSALIYEAKLSVAVEALREECSCADEYGTTVKCEPCEALERLGEK